MSERPNLSKGPSGTSSAATPPAGGAKPPRFVLIAVALLALSGIAAVLASATLYTSSVKTWVRDSARDSIGNSMKDKFGDVKKAGGTASAGQLSSLQNQITQVKATPSDQLTPVANRIKSSVTALKPGAAKKGKDALDDIDDQADKARNIGDTIAKQQKGALISSIVVLVALGVAAAAAYRGRYWARWAIIGLWVLATFTGTLAGLGSVMSVGSDIPAPFKIPAFVSGLALVAAVVLTNLRPSTAFFNLSRPDRGARPQRRGLFAPPAPRTTAGRGAARGTAPAATEPAVSRTNPERGRSKQRSSDAAVAKGADLARTRAKAASKSRRTGS